MIKKLVKYGKKMMALFLIGSLSLPSYATVGAADGSAFVTKAEFDAALSDFNARLTTFEAGINSKIDSQVSSYLDRNGIWNGKSQTINGTYDSSKKAYKYELPIVNWTSTNSYGQATKKLIDSCNKSGLLVFNFSTYITGYLTIYSMGTNTDTVPKLYFVCSVNAGYFNTYQKALDYIIGSKYCNLVPIVYYGERKAVRDYKTCSLHNMAMYGMFFVSKGDPIYVNTVGLMCNYYGSSVGWYNDFSNGTQYGSFAIDSVDIYYQFADIY